MLMILKVTAGREVNSSFFCFESSSCCQLFFWCVQLVDGVKKIFEKEKMTSSDSLMAGFALVAGFGVFSCLVIRRK